MVGGAIYGLIGAALAIGFLLVSSFFTPYIWMPVAFSVLFASWLGTLPAVRDRRLIWPIGIALVIVVTALWVRSQGLLVVGRQPHTPEKLLVSWAATLVITSLVLAAIWLSRFHGIKPKLGWLAFLLCLSLVVTLASSSAASAGRMVHWFMAYLHWDQAGAERTVVVIRKSIHLCFYGFVGFTAWRAALQAGCRKNAAFLFAIVCAILLASFDEMRQSTQPGRGSSIWDVLLDTSGAGATLGISYLAGLRQGPRADSAKRPQ